MFTDFNEYELLEIFEREPISIVAEGAGIFLYTKNDHHGFELSMILSIYEKKCKISLIFDGFINPIFDFELTNVESLKCSNGNLRIRRKDGDDIEISFKPNFAINSENLK